MKPNLSCVVGNEKPIWSKIIRQLTDGAENFLYFTAYSAGNHVRELNRTMRGMQRILYVGTKYDVSKAPTLCSKSWRCIYTASRAVDFSDAFSRENRQVRLGTTKDTYP